jgi:hypothetical protein
VKLFLSTVFLIISFAATSQELFVFTEPASNMPVKSLGFRANNYLMKNSSTKTVSYHLLPEFMWGVSKKLMISAEAFFSNRDKGFTAEGAQVYGKYRFYSIDEVHNHFRMAVYGRYSFNNSDIHQQAIDFYGHNSGYEMGLIATKLKGKVAVSASSSYLHALNNNKEKFIYGNSRRNAVNYTLSAGRLMIPKEYVNYKQTNMNLMLEFLGQTNTGSGRTYIDMGSSVQLIFLSRIRVDAGYRFPLVETHDRSSSRGFLVRLEYHIFNVY